MSLCFKRKWHLFECQSDKKRRTDIEEELFHLLVHSPDALKPAAWHSIEVLYVGGRGLSSFLSQVHWQGAGLEVEHPRHKPGLPYRMLTF